MKQIENNLDPRFWLIDIITDDMRKTHCLMKGSKQVKPIMEKVLKSELTNAVYIP